MEDIIALLQEDEEAVQVHTHPDYYVTNRGRVISVKRRGVRETFVRTLSLIDYRQQATFGSHWNKRSGGNLSRWVGRYFLPDFEEHLEVCHIDETLPPPMIDDVSNLFVGTHKQNHEDAAEKGRMHYKALEVDVDELWEDFISMGYEATAYFHHMSEITVRKYLGVWKAVESHRWRKRR